MNNITVKNMQSSSTRCVWIRPSACVRSDPRALGAGLAEQYQKEEGLQLDLQCFDSLSLVARTWVTMSLYISSCIKPFKLKRESFYDKGFIVLKQEGGQSVVWERW